MIAVPHTAEAIDPMEVLAFWRAAGPDKWFEKDAAFDAEVAARFSCLWQAARDGKLAPWEETPQAALALLIVLDQFPRNMFRGDRRAYETDGLARSVADRAIGRGFDRQASHAERQFFICRSNTRKTSPIRNAASRSRAATATMSSRNTPSDMPTSSVASGGSRTATRRWAAPPGRRSRPSSTPAALQADRMHGAQARPSRSNLRRRTLNACCGVNYASRHAAELGLRRGRRGIFAPISHE